MVVYRTFLASLLISAPLTDAMSTTLLQAELRNWPLGDISLSPSRTHNLEISIRREVEVERSLNYRQFSEVVSTSLAPFTQLQNVAAVTSIELALSEASATDANSRYVSSSPTIDSSSISSSHYASSTSTVLGIGMVSGRLIKALGERSLGLIEIIAVKRRLRVIASRLPTTSPEFWNGTNEEATEIVRDLRRFLR